MLAPSALNLAPAWMRVAFWANFYAWFAVEMWVWLRERRLASGQRRDRGSLIWVVSWIWAGVWIGFTAMYNFSFSAMHPPAASWFALGILCTWLGEAFRLWAIHTLGAFFRVRVEIQAEHRIISHGPYRFLRNPAYTGATLALLGIGLTMRNWTAVLACFFGILIAYARRIRVEQRTLEAHFGDPYRAYIRRTWALIPFLW